MAIIDQQIRNGVSAHRIKAARGTYDFAVNGGAVGTIALLGGTSIPAGATILGGWVEILTALASGGAATGALQVEGAGDIVPAQTLGTWTVGRKDIVPAKATSAVLATTKDVRTTAARDISFVIATAALTAGKFVVVLQWVDPLAP